MTYKQEPIAIVGMACRFPGAKNIQEFWNLLKNGVDAVREVPKDRWDIDAFYDPDPNKPGKMSSRWGGFLDKVDEFDPFFFRIPPKEAIRLDPQHRLLLEVSWEALEDAGQTKKTLSGSLTSVFIGMMYSDYGLMQIGRIVNSNSYTTTGSTLSVAPNRISYTFDLRGPSMLVDTSCSSSLVATHLACRSLLTGEADLAIAGGANIMLFPALSINYSKTGLLAPDGRCKAFDSRANGYVRGEGVGIVVLKPLSKAIADGDRVYAVILASAVGQDGGGNTFKTPNQRGQQDVIREAYNRAGIDPSLVQYIEAHGTGTAVGDPTEAKALGRILAVNRDTTNICSIGSVKSNIGHLEPAAGIAGLIKTALCIKNRELPKSLHCNIPNPEIPFQELHLKVQTELSAWPNPDKTLIAGVNAFGLSGTNAHVVLAEAPKEAQVEEDVVFSPYHVLTLSAHNEPALKQMARDYQSFLKEKDFSLADICYSASVRRSHHDYRLAIVGDSKESFSQQLELFIQNQSTNTVVSANNMTGQVPPVVFLFSGQGPQWWAMGRQLLETHKVFSQTIKDCDQILSQYASWSLLEELTATEEKSNINKPEIAQPALFAIQIALANVWKSWGIIPSAVIGHSLGEVAAAYISSALSLEDALKVIFERGRLMQEVAGQGKTMAVEISHSEAIEIISSYGGTLSIAAVNSPSSVTISGDSDAIDKLAESLKEKSIFHKVLGVNIAFHSHHMDSLVSSLESALANIQPLKSEIPIFSTVTGEEIDSTVMNNVYWGHNLRDTVRFASAIENLAKAGHKLFLEVSPHPVLATVVNQCLRGNQIKIFASLRRGQSDYLTLYTSLANFYVLGFDVDFSKFFAKTQQLISLPLYPWQRDRYWLEEDLTKHLLVDGTLFSSSEKIHSKQDNVLLATASKLVEMLSLLGVKVSVDDSAVLSARNKFDNLLTASSSSKQSVENSKEQTKQVLVNNPTTENQVTQMSITNYLKELIAKVAGFAIDKIDLEQPVNRLGLDSLLSIELQNQIESKFNVKISIKSIMQGATLSQIANQLFEEVSKNSAVTNTSVSGSSMSASGSSDSSGYNRESIANYLKELIAKVAGFAIDKIDLEQPVNRLGLDSLLSIELQNQIESKFNVKISIKSIMQGATLSQIANQLFEDLKSKSPAKNEVKTSVLTEKTKTQSSLIICHKPVTNPRLRLFCFPYSGSGASLFLDWHSYLPSDVELCAIELPGRETLVDKVAFTRLKPLVESLAAAITPYLDRKFAFLGYSLGSLVSFELARQLRVDKKPCPEHLFVCAHRAPHLPYTLPKRHSLPEKQFIEEVRRYGGTPEAVFKNKELLSLVIKILRADLALIETYQYLEQSPLECHISAFGGYGDPEISESDMQAWAKETSGNFDLNMFDGDHFFVRNNNNRSKLCEVISKILFTIEG
jgi:acyl transferase domain-containing protein/surfactin synthase thioesterase subunit